jgi:hypothetical protein
MAKTKIKKVAQKKKKTPPTNAALIHNFFERPRGAWARSVQGIIFAFIFLSVALVALETFLPDLYYANLATFEIINAIILAAFTVEFIFRLFSAKHALKFATRPINIVDFLAVFPNYIELLLPLALNTTSARVIRLLRPLRLLRVLRAFKIFRYKDALSATFHYQGSILQAITPVIFLFAAIKGGVWALEDGGRWLSDPNLGVLFTIIGFALGIVLSQKIATTHAKYLQVEEASARLYSSLQTLSTMLNNGKVRFGYGTRRCAQWTREYLKVLEKPDADNASLTKENQRLFSDIIAVKNVHEYAIEVFQNIQEDANFTLGKKVRVTPKAYDNLLHQATLLYLALLVAFIPGLSGMLSIVVTTYILYGMYYLTQDLDSIFSGDYTLTRVDLTELRDFAEKG